MGINRNKSSITIANEILSLAIVLFLYSCVPNSKEDLNAIERNENTPSLQITNLTSLISDSGLIKYQIKTPELLQYDTKSEPYTEFPKGIQITSLDKEGKMNADIKANYAKYLKKKELWQLKNDVQAVNFEGNIINTEELFWDMISHRIYSDKYIKITTSQQIITGFGFESNEDFSKYTIQKINGVIELEE